MAANPNFLYLKDNVKKQRVTLLQGGTRSGKTYAAIYYVMWLCKHYSNLEIDIVRDTFTALKATAWKDFKDVLIQHEIYNEAHHNKTDHSYNLWGNNINYYGADTPAKIHGRSRDILWVNEAHQFPAETIDQLFPRTRHKIIADYNPALGLEHWLDTYIEQYPPCITTYKDNPHLTEAQIQDIESRKGNQYWWQVYGSGQRANREGAIFTNWTTGEFDTSLPYCYGQDYGFSVDPTTLVKVAVDKKNKKIYVDECFYNKNQLGTEAIYELNKAHLHKISDLIIADSAEPRLIDELRRKGLNIRGAIKGQGSVTAGITQMQDYQIIVTERSSNTRKELSNYCWSDKRAGIPIDDYNHCFTGETLITTINGQVPIKDINEGDLVLTSQGYKKVLVKFNNGLKQVNKYLIQFDTFSVSLCSTKEHKIKTEKEWKQISQLQNNDLLYHYKSLTEKNIDYTQTKDTLAGDVKDFMLKFGNTIKAIFQKATMCIILMAIHTITIFPIYLWFMVNYILGLKAKEDLKTIPNLQKSFMLKGLKKLKSGISQQKEKNGIGNMLLQMGLEYLKRLKEYVMFVQKHLLQILNITKYVQQNVKQNKEEIAELIILKSNANIAVKNLKLINIQELSIVHVSVGNSQEKQVYDLMIEDCHEYFANGVLVHNCIDPIRYSVKELSQTSLSLPKHFANR
jgi:PBSX family phage terminase large subunit